MSYRLVQGRYEVRWRDSSGRHRAKRFRDKDAAQEFDESIHDHDVPERSKTRRHGQSGGVYPYETSSGTKWRYVVRRSDGTATSKRGFSSESAARTARRRITERKERGEVLHTNRTFGNWWNAWLRQRRPYLEPNSWRAYEVDGRKRLLPEFESVRLDKLDAELVRAWMVDQAGRVEAGDIAAKTINNTLGTLVVCLNAAVKDRVIASNPALGIERLPAAHVEHDFLRLHEIPLYLDACVAVYRPLAEVLVRGGLRISEAIDLHVADLELEETGGFIVVCRSQKKTRTRTTASGSTKGDSSAALRLAPV